MNTTREHPLTDAMHFVSRGIDHDKHNKWNYDDQLAPKLDIKPVYGVYGIGENFEIAGEAIPGVLLSAANGDDTRPWIEAYFEASFYDGEQEAAQGLDFGFPGDLEAATVLADLIGAEVWTAIPYGAQTRCSYLLFPNKEK